MKAVISADFVASLARKLEYEKPTKQYEVRDTKLRKFVLRVQPTGVMSYRVELSRTNKMTIGTHGAISTKEAREQAQKLIAQSTLGTLPEKKNDSITYKEFVEHEYKPWMLNVNKTSVREFDKLKDILSYLGNKQLYEISVHLLDKWRVEQLSSGICNATINRKMNPFKASLNKAVEWGFLKAYPLKGLKALKVEDDSVVRYLSNDEEQRLFSTLSSFKGQAIYYMTLLAYNCGLRKNEVLSLTWDNIDWKQKQLSVRAAYSKSSKTRHIPINDYLFMQLGLWWQAAGSPNKGLVFPSPLTGIKYENITGYWHRLLAEAKIENFRFHDLRHHFASKLVMAGVDLNTVRELLGHSDIKMTLIYAHLSPQHKADAVAKLCS